MDDIIIILIVAIIVISVSFYIYKNREKGVKCIGCPDSKGCNGNCSMCPSKEK